MTGSSSPATGTLMQPTRRENPGARHGTRTLLAPHREAHDPEPPRGPVVLHVVEAFGGGVAAAVRDYARATPECDHHLLCHLRPEAVNLEDEWDTDFASVRFLPGGHLANLKATRWAISEIHPDVIHSHSSYAGVYARLAVGHLPRKPVDTLSPLRTPGAPTTRAERHGDLLREGQRRRRLRAEKLAERGPLRRKVQKYFDPALAHIKQVYTPHAWSFSRLDHSRLTRLGFWALEGALAARTDVLAGCSKAENNVAHWGPVSPRTVYVPNVAEPDSVRKPTKGADEPLVLAGAGRLTAQKDPVFFAETVQAIRDAGFRVAPIWVGGGDEDVEQLFRDYDIKVTGWISHEQVQEQLKTADVYLHTARWEGFPITVLEAAANHIPVIVRRIRVFDDSGLPLVVDTPQDVAARWNEIVDPETRDHLCGWSQQALWENCRKIQRDRLCEIYGVHVPLLEKKALGAPSTP